MTGSHFEGQVLEGLRNLRKDQGETRKSLERMSDKFETFQIRTAERLVTVEVRAKGHGKLWGLIGGIVAAIVSAGLLSLLGG